MRLAADEGTRETTWVLILAFVCYVTLGKLLTISVSMTWILVNVRI